MHIEARSRPPMLFLTFAPINGHNHLPLMAAIISYCCSDHHALLRPICTDGRWTITQGTHNKKARPLPKATHHGGCCAKSRRHTKGARLQMHSPVYCCYLQITTLLLFFQPNTHEYGTLQKYLQYLSTVLLQTISNYILSHQLPIQQLEIRGKTITMCRRFGRGIGTGPTAIGIYLPNLPLYT